MQVILGDITKIKADAIVNAASADLMPHPGICSAIYAAADSELLKMVCKRIGHCRIGHAVATLLADSKQNTSFMLPEPDGMGAIKEKKS